MLKTNLTLAGRCLAARPTIQQVSLWETIINRLFESLTRTPYSLTREHIAGALAAVGSTEVNTRLLQMLSNEQLESSVRRSIADALGTLGERSVAPDLLRLLSNRQLDNYMRGSIADALGTLGERSIAPDLLHLLSNRQLEPHLRQSIAEALGILVNDEEDIQDLVALLPTSDIADYIHRALWTTSHRAGVRIFIIEGVDGEKQVEIVKL